MKKLFYLFLLPLMLWSCSSEEDMLIESIETSISTT